MAFLAASLKSLTMPGISSTFSRRGGEKSMGNTSGPVSSTTTGLSVQEMGACPLGWKPARELTLDSVGVSARKRSSRGRRKLNLPVLETLPTCQIWQKKTPPFSWTASTIGFHASTCSWVQIPGVSLYLQTREDDPSFPSEVEQAC